MDYARAGNLFALLAILAFCGCRSPESRPGLSQDPLDPTGREHPADLKHHIRDNAASLLYDLLNDEKNVNKLLIVKRESKALEELIDEISATAAAGAKKLEQLAAADRTLHLDVMELPSGEAATREAIAKTTTSDLLHVKGPDFEFKLLLTQAEALNYGAHLAKVAAANESRPGSARQFSSLSEQLQRLHDRVVARLNTHENKPR